MEKVVDDEFGYFHLGGSHEDHQLVDRLVRLRNQRCQVELDVHIEVLRWTEDFASELIRTFEFYTVTLNKRWWQCSFTVSDQSNEHFLAAVRELARLKLVRKLIFSNSRLSRTLDINEAFAQVIETIFHEADDLETLQFENFQLHDAKAVRILAKGLNSSDAVVANGKGTKNLIFHGRLGTPASAFGAGIASNKTLRSFCLSYAYLNDDVLSNILEAFVGHQTLRELSLGRKDVNSLSLESLGRVLSSPSCRIRSLNLSECNLLNVKSFVHILPNMSTSLRSLDLSGNEIRNKRANLLLRSIIQKATNLEYLDLSGNYIDDINIISKNLGVVDTSRPCRLRVLDLDDNGYLADNMVADLAYAGGSIEMESESDHDIGISDNSDTSISDSDNDPQNDPVAAMKLLLGVFPTLCYFGEDFEEFFEGRLPDTISRQVEQNRVLGCLSQDAALPPSIWPVVLARINRDRLLKHLSTERKANVVYTILQGPALLGRDSMV